MNKMYYLTQDRLNAATAEELAEQHGLELEVVEPRDVPRLSEGYIILDWDFLPADLRSNLLGGSRVIPIGVHGHNLGESLESFLPEQGTVWSRWLDDEFFHMIIGQFASARAGHHRMQP